MDKNWNKRLKESRIKAKLTLKKVGSLMNSNLTEQSLIKYENGNVFPKIDVLEELCNLYNVTIDYILYGDESNFHFSIPTENVLTTFFFLLHKKAIIYNKDSNTIEIKDHKLALDIYKLSVFNKKKEITCISDMQSLISGIKKISVD